MSREKQIEEIKNVLLRMNVCEMYDEIKCIYDCEECRAIQIYNAGYRKQSEGEWVEIPNPWKMEDGSHIYVCSVCKEQISVLGNPLHYCGYCGAKMKGGAE